MTSEPKNIYFVSLGSYALGETIMALEFARSLPASSYRPCFIVSPSSSALLKKESQIVFTELIFNAHKINELIARDFLERYEPELIILCDFLTFDYSRPDFGISFEFLRNYDAPIISLDSYEWGSSDFKLDFITGLDTPLTSIFFDLDGALRPCPLNKPAPADEKVACYSFFHQIKPVKIEDAKRAREELGIKPEDFVIFTANALWQSLRPPGKPVGLFGNLVSELLPRYMSGFDAEVHWIRVGPERQKGRVKSGNITEYNFPILPEEDFDRFLAASDLLITNNVASTTLAKCIRFGGKALLLYNSIQANGPDDLSVYEHVQINNSTLRLMENAYPIYPFLMFPLGWYRFLSPVMRSNPYVETFHQCEILDEQRVISLLREAVSSRDSKLGEKRDQYDQLLKELYSPRECVDHFLTFNGVN